MITFLAEQASAFPLIMMVGLFAVMYFFMIRPQKKQEKEVARMRNSIIVGDEICTNGGIIGRVCTIKDDILTLEINKDRTRMKIYRWAVREVVNPMPRNDVPEEPKESKETKKEEEKKD
ncbi:MAG: preprotein translocase subunit YajC [Ruminococcaceae bacterium]|nr:preprotein translocase subunit YajC [Oscillospiraceae bacterium]